jgi:hypothetical protein
MAPRDGSGWCAPKPRCSRGCCNSSRSCLRLTSSNPILGLVARWSFLGNDGYPSLPRRQDVTKRAPRASTGRRPMRPPEQRSPGPERQAATHWSRANLPWAQEVQGLLACDLTPSARQELWHSFTTSVGIPQNTAADRERARALYVPFRVLVGRTLAAAAALERSLDRDSVERRRAGRAGFRPRTRHLPRGPRLGAEAVPPLPLGGPGGGGAAARVNPALDPPRLPGPPGGRDPRVSDADRATPPSETAPGHPLPRSPSEVRALTLDCILIRRIRFHSIRSSVVAHTGPQGYPCRRGRQRPASRRQHRRSR